MNKTRRRQGEMQYTVKRSCGDSEIVQIFGTNAHGERDRKVAWLESQPCYKHCQEQAVAAAILLSEKLELPKLEGSEKQIAWAITIRSKFVKSLMEWADEYSGRLARGIKDNKITEEYAEDQRQLFIGLGQRMVSSTQAKFWIDNRDLGVKELAAQFK
jgi:hypothetical protein